MPYRDGEFDVVASVVGAMFAPRPELVAAEMKRVCRSGGTIAMANWTPDGFIGQMFKAIAKYIAPAGMPSPVLWGEKRVVRERMRDELVALWSAANTGLNGTARVEAEYLEVVAVRA